jgi:hypothetical protein
MRSVTNVLKTRVRLDAAAATGWVLAVRIEAGGTDLGAFPDRDSERGILLCAIVLCSPFKAAPGGRLCLT